MENHPFWWFFEKTAKSGGKPPISTVFSKNRQKWWKTTNFWHILKNRPKLVIFAWNLQIIGQIKLSFGWETTTFRAFLKNWKSGGKPPVLVVFWKNRKKWWKTTHFDGFFKKPLNWVVFHHFTGFLKKPEKWWFSTQIWPFSVPSTAC